MLKRLFFLLTVATFFAACNNSNNTANKDGAITNETESVTTESGTQMPAFTMLNAQGEAVDLKSFAGKKVLVNLWATWCPPCRVEMPSLEKLHQSVDKEKTAFVMLSLDDDFEKAKKYVKDNNLDLPVYYPKTTDLPELFNVRGIPATFIFNEQGQLIKSMEGADDYDTDAYRQLLK